MRDFFEVWKEPQRPQQQEGSGEEKRGGKEGKAEGPRGEEHSQAV